MLLSMQLSAQGDLQFNRVLNLDYSTFCNNQGLEYSAGSFTVPNNKVWKITYSSVYSSSNQNYAGVIKINNIIVNIGSISSPSPTKSPLWLQSGNYNVSLYSVSTTNTTIVGALSVLEFNIIP